MELKDYAKQLIRPYVLRGGSLQQLADGMTAVFCSDYHVQIGGYIWKRSELAKPDGQGIQLGRYEVGVWMAEGDVIGRFSLSELYKEILLEKKQVKMEQLSLF